MITEPNHITFECTGRREYVNSAIIGTSDGEFVYGGYDSDLFDATDLTTHEREELADYMIALWTKFKSPHAAHQQGG